MMKLNSIVLLAVSFPIVLGLTARAQEKFKGKSATAKAAATEAAPTGTSFEKIKSLSGEWNAVHGPGDHGKEKLGVVTYKVIAAGSAVQETAFAGTDKEMVTIFYQDGDDLALTHYCVLQNRPQMREVKQTDPNKIVLVCQKEENAKIEGQDHMHQATFTFTDADHVKAEWVLYKGGNPDATHSFDLIRVKGSTKPQNAQKPPKLQQKMKAAIPSAN